MKYLKFKFAICLLVTINLFAQTKELTLEAIWAGTFRSEDMDVLRPMGNGQDYSTLNFDRYTGNTSIGIYTYEKLSKMKALINSIEDEGPKYKTLINSKDYDEITYFTDYQFNKDATKVLLATEEEYIYRHSTLGKYYVLDTISNVLKLVSDMKIQEPTFSPDGTKVAYGVNNNLFIKDLDTGETTQFTFDGKKNKIINGITDWVYEEEFAFVRAFDWNSSGDKIAYIKFDETKVPEFSMDLYTKGLYPTQHTFKYPKAGETNASVSLHVYDLNTSLTTKISLNKEYEDFYIPRIKWTNESDILSAQYMNRLQNELDLWFVNAKTDSINLVLTEKDSAYIDVTDNLTFLKDNSFIWTSEKDGYNHIYHYSKSGELINQITKGNWDVTDYYGFDEKSSTVFYQSVENGSINRDVYSVKLNGRNKIRLSNKAGTNDASFNADFSLYINKFSNVVKPPEYTLHDVASGSFIKQLQDNKRLLKTISEYKTSIKEFSTLNMGDYDLNMWMIKPVDFDESKEYPLFMVQYSGPGSQQVANHWNDINDYWFQHIAQQGYIVACVDGRGTGFKGADFKKITQNQLGKYEVEDQNRAARKLGRLPYIDEDRIGIWGWSYGGFVSSNCLFKGANIFKMAIAVAPVTSWRFYDTIYTERYMGLPQDNESGYDDNSPINYVEKLKGDFLLVHGSADDNVHVQNTMLLSEALIQADKPFDLAIYPDKNHGIYGGNTRLHLYKKMTNFIRETLGDKIK